MLPLHSRGHITQLEQLRREERSELEKIKNLPFPTRVKKAAHIKIKYQKLKSDLRHNLYINKHRSR